MKRPNKRIFMAHKPISREIQQSVDVSFEEVEIKEDALTETEPEIKEENVVEEIIPSKKARKSTMKATSSESATTETTNENK